MQQKYSGTLAEGKWNADIMKKSSSGMWRRIGLLRTYVSVQCVASIFRADESANENSVADFFYPKDGG
jgi:hypothetical protein